MWLNKHIKQRHQRWLKRRMPANSQQVLNHRNIFIFPSKAGLGFVFAVALLWLLGTNYQNNLIIVLAFLLLSLLHTCIFYTYANFSGLSIQVKHVGPCFANGMACVTLQLKANTQQKKAKKTYENLQLSFPNAPAIYINVVAGQTQTVVLQLPVGQRGWYLAPRLTLSTVYPLGIMRAWSYLDMDIQVLVYPQPITADMPSIKSAAVNDDNKAQQVLVSTNIAEDISHLRDYQYGDSPRHIAWKTYAKGQGLNTKAYENVIAAEQQQWLDWNDFTGIATEGRLSRLCHCVLTADQQQQAYGLRLPGSTTPIGSGANHRQEALAALALYGKPKPVSEPVS